MNTEEDLAIDALAQLLPQQFVNVAATCVGGNSRIFQVDASLGRYALKKYPLELDDLRQRQATERAALLFLGEGAMLDVPRFHQSWKQYSLFSWVDGRPIHIVEQRHLAQAASILLAIQEQSSRAESHQFPAAFEACASLDALERQLHERIDALGLALFDDRAMQHDITNDLRNACNAASVRARSRYDEFGFSTAWLPTEELRLIHGDYGAHNMLDDGERVWLLDFEYFGWDDPVKMVADFALHPGKELAPAERRFFLDQTRARLAENEACLKRLDALLPMFAVRWACIVLKTLLPRRASLREASAAVFTREEQLSKATSLLTLCEREGLA